MSDHETKESEMTYELEEFREIIRDKFKDLNLIIDSSENKDICEIEYIDLLNKSSNLLEKPFIFKSPQDFLKNLAKNHKILNIYKEF